MKEHALRPVRIPHIPQVSCYIYCGFSACNMAGLQLNHMFIGNSRPRVFPTFPEPTATTTKKRAKANTGAKRGPKKATATKASKPAGVTKKKAPAKKATTATKARQLCRAYICSSLTISIGQGCCEESRRLC